jgi:hypothetical protein
MGNVEIALAPAVGTAGSAGGSEESGVGHGEGQWWSSHLDLDRAGTWDLPGGGLWPVGLGSEAMGEKTAAGGDIWAGPLPFLICRWREKNMI